MDKSMCSLRGLRYVFKQYMIPLLCSEQPPLLQSYGGVLTEVKEDADTIVVQFAGVDELRRKYWFSKTIYVVEAAFVNICINSGRYKENLPRPERKGMGGQPVGSV